MNAVGKCDIGLRRLNNEDAIYVHKDDCSSNFPYFIVADGMGGHEAGETASKAAIDAFNEYLANQNALSSKEDTLDLFVSAIRYANERIINMVKTRPELSGMGTTFIAATIIDKKLLAVHVGDSRIYLLKSGTLSQLTKDHSYVMEMVKLGKITSEEAKEHPKRNIITRSLGTLEHSDPDTIINDIGESSYTVLICSDGLTTMLCDDEIENILKSDESLEKKAEKLINKAKENGGADNISVILIDEEATK